MGLLDRFLYLRITSAEPENLLSSLTFLGVDVWDVVQIDMLTMEMKIRKSQFHSVQTYIQRIGGSCRIIKKAGALWYIEESLKRPVLVLGMALFLFLSLFTSERIFFVKVTGNQTIQDNLIRSQAEVCGIQFGAKASKVRSEDVKNKLLGKLPQLQWVGVTTSGSVATIQVKERSLQELMSAKKDAVCNIIAARDGTITEQTVYRGNPLFQVGQTVKAGDILISGYTDCGIMLKTELASGEVFAHTLRESQVVAPFSSQARGEFKGSHTCRKLHVGKKVINLCNHSGILDTGCVKIYSEEYWTLPGNFRLPVSIIKEKYFFYEQVEPQPSNIESFQWLPEFACKYLVSQMIAGEILNEELRWEISNGVCILTGEYACHEMIGQVKYEENLVQNAEDNGTNS